MKKAICSCLMIILLLCTAVTAFAVEPLVLHVEGYSVKDKDINIYLNTNLQELPKNDEISLSIGNINLPIKAIKRVSDDDQGTSMIFLADVSGSIGSGKLQNIKDTLNLMVEQMSAHDNVSILTVGDEANAQPFASDKEQIKNQIAAINGMSQNTNLYSGISKALDILSTNESSHGKKCIVIMSDGEDDDIKGITREEVNSKIEKARIPIYTVAMLGTNPADKYVQTSKILGSFARLSPGGVDYIHELNKTSSSKIASDIKASLEKSLILTADLSGFKSEGNEMYMQLELKVPSEGKVLDGYSIKTAGLTTEKTAKETSKQAQTPTTNTQSHSNPQAKSSSIMLWLILAAALIIIILVIIIVLKKRKKLKLNGENLQEITPNGVGGVAEPVVEEGKTSNTVNTGTEPEPKHVPEVIKTPDVTIRLTKMGKIEEQVFNSDIFGELLIGRDPSKSTLSFPGDDLLSSLHCVIKYEAKDLTIQDLGSTNGTYVNGVPISGVFKLESDDIILIGSLELRINW